MASIRRLYEIRNHFDVAAATEKLAILSALDSIDARSATDLGRLHTALCFIRAFPDSDAHYLLARQHLLKFVDRIDAHDDAKLHQLWDTGIVGTPVHYSFSFDVASWLARRAIGAVSIDWEDTHDPPGLDEILTQLLHPAEDEYFDSGQVSAREWIELAAANSPGTDFDWLMAQLGETRLRSFWAALYDAADLWLTWDLGDSRYAKSTNAYPVRHIGTREAGMRRPGHFNKREIARPLEDVVLLDSSDGRKMIDVAMASLATRHRETYHFNHANSHEVYLIDVGEGIAIALFGLLPEHRFPLECTMGYMILSNGMPVGYGGSSIVFRQVNTGINIFDEYRGSEAAFLWVQVMRVYHALAGCNRFIANPYQFGADNDEALKSGAFWFYYRLGYRPVVLETRMLARQEAHRIRQDSNYRSNLATLKRLSSCDMHLTMPGARASEFFDEQWLTTSGMLASRILSEAGGQTRRKSAGRVVSSVARDLDLVDYDDWSADERRGLERLAPLVAATHPARWTPAEKASMRELLRSKGGAAEARYARALGEHRRFLAELRKICRDAEEIA